MNRFPKRTLRRLREEAIEATHLVATCVNAAGIQNVEKQYEIIEKLRRAVQESEKSIGLVRVKFILNHNVPQIVSIFDLTKPRRGERRDLLPRQFVGAILGNIDSELERITSTRWRWVAIPSAAVAIVTVIGVMGKMGQVSRTKKLSSLDTPGPSPAHTPIVTTPTPTPNSPPAATSTPSPAPTSTATAAPTETPTPTPTATPTPNLTPTAPPTAPPQPLDSTEGAEKSKPKKAQRFKLGPILIDVNGVKNARSDLQIYTTITNQSGRVVYVFAGSPDPIGASWRQLAGEFQALTGRGSDDKNSTFWLESVEGFTRVRDKYFRGENIYIELAPQESASASFLLANNWLTGPELGKMVNISIEFAIMTDLRAKGSHQTKALTLTNWPLE